MPMPGNLELASDSFAIFFETNEDIDTGRLGRFISALSLEVERYPDFHGEAKLTLRSAKSGSLLIEFVIVMAALATIGSFVHQVTVAAKNSRQPKFCRRLAELMADDSIPHMQVAYIDPRGKQVEVTINRKEMPAYQSLQDRRRTAARANPNVLTFDGETVTFDGEPITVPPARRRSQADESELLDDQLASRDTVLPAGRANSASQGKSLKMTLAGEFERDADGSYWFKSGGTVFAAEFGEKASSHPQEGRSTTIGAILNPAEPNKIFVTGTAV